LKNGNIILFLAVLLLNISILPLDLAARIVPAELNTSLSAQPKHASMTRLHEVSQNTLRSKLVKGKRYHHPTQRPDDPLSIHHARPFYVVTYQDQEVHPVLTTHSNTDTPVYIGCIHSSDYISKIFHPPTD